MNTYLYGDYPAIGCRRRKFHSTMGSLLHQFSLQQRPPSCFGHESTWVNSLTLLTTGSNCLLTTQFLSSQSIFTLLVVPIHIPLSPSACTTQGMVSPSLLSSSSGYPTSLQGYNTCWLGNLTTGIRRIIDYIEVFLLQ